MRKKIVFATETYRYLKEKLLALTPLSEPAFLAGQIECKNFSDGERYHRILTDVDDQDVILFGGTVSDSDTLEVYDLACALVKLGARSLTLVVPFFGYSTMERAVKKGEVVKAKTRARLFSTIPSGSLENTIVLLDLHSEGIPHYFEGSVRSIHLYAKPIIIAAARKIGGDDFVLACTDSGRAKWVESLANELHVPAAYVLKRRFENGSLRLSAVSAQVESKKVVIYDDMIRSGSSLIQAAQAYKEAGATEVHAIATHGLFSSQCLEHMQDSGLFHSLVTTDSHPKAEELRTRVLKKLDTHVESIAPLLLQYFLAHLENNVS